MPPPRLRRLPRQTISRSARPLLPLCLLALPWPCELVSWDVRRPSVSFGDNSWELGIQESGVAPAVFDELFADTLEDVGGIVSRPQPNATIWSAFLEDFSMRKTETLIMEMDTPSVAWRYALPRNMVNVLNRASRRACWKRCPADLASKRGCCLDKEHCPRLFDVIEQVVGRGNDWLSRAFVDFSAQLSRVMQAQWPLAQPSLLPYALRASSTVEQVMRFLIVLWSRYASNPSVRWCLSSRMGAILREKALEALELHREMQRVQSVISWEVIATGRYRDFRWGQVGMQADMLQEWIQKASNVLVALKRGLHYVRLETKHGWARMTEDLAASESLVAKDGGEYPGLILARSRFADEWFLDKPLARFLLRHVLTAGDSLGEFGAFGGHYSQWLNETGLVEAFAFDGIPDVGRITAGRVSELQLAQRFDLGRRFDWILCLEVGEHLPKGSEDVLLDNIRRHAKVGAVISWATPDYPSPYHPNTLLEEESRAVIERHGFRRDIEKTRQLRETAETEWLKQTASVYYVTEPSSA
eukprot:TRINITY_DN71802_c0_g1_i1.p1 TRINITY_DN71802_c0_g1~~TRINITY_DN71802_c0_g1_i1.p1  ORF type:complete len:546 (+),score=139.61 TRINITY_DN71802_c0_g1_i1:52-1638(+)